MFLHFCEPGASRAAAAEENGQTTPGGVVVMAVRCSVGLFPPTASALVPPSAVHFGSTNPVKRPLNCTTNSISGDSPETACVGAVLTGARVCAAQIMSFGAAVQIQAPLIPDWRRVWVKHM